MKITEITVTLHYVEPEVVRVLEVPADIALGRLHLTLQAAFGWHNAHLFQFCVGEPYQMDGTCWVLPDFADRPNDLDVEKAALSEALDMAASDQLTYLYDFGDDWEHVIAAGETREAEPGVVYPRLTGATGNCPPEDVGGPPGYQMFREAMADPKHPEHEELSDWYGGPFDAMAPDEKRLSRDVAALAKKWSN